MDQHPGILNFFKPFGIKRLEEIQNVQNWAFQIFSNHFGAKSVTLSESVISNKYLFYSNSFTMKLAKISAFKISSYTGPSVYLM